MHKVQVAKIAKLEIDITLDFRFENIYVHTITNGEFVKVWNEGKKRKGDKPTDNYLVFEGQCEIEQYDSLLAADVKLRPEFLGVLGMLTFMTGEVFTVFQFHSSRSFAIDEFWNTISSNRFFYYGDKKRALLNILQFLKKASQTERALVFSVLDRYRKACYMVKESEESLVYSDESFLAYFHILELLAGQFESTLKTKIKSSIVTFVGELFSNVYLYGETKVSNERTSKQNLIEQLFIPEIPVSAKICHMYNELKMFSGKSRQIIEGFVKFRNDIAHGRAVYNKQLLFPLPPFFQQVKEIDKEIGTMSLIAARTIDVYLKSDLYKWQWDKYLKNFPAPLDAVKLFLTEKNYLQLSESEFLKGYTYGVTPWMLTYYYFYKKIHASLFEAALKKILMELALDKKSIKAFLEPCILLSDSKDDELRAKCQELIRTAFEKKYPEMRARDYLKEFEHRFQLSWFVSYLSE
jgi:hypothetical protein